MMNRFLSLAALAAVLSACASPATETPVANSAPVAAAAPAEANTFAPAEPEREQRTGSMTAKRRAPAKAPAVPPAGS